MKTFFQNLQFSKTYFLLKFLLVTTVVLTSCTQNASTRFEFKQNDGFKNVSNRVIKHYKNDSLKLVAAKFLLNNAQYHSFYSGETLKHYDSIFHYIASLKNVNKAEEKLLVTQYRDALKERVGVLDKKHLTVNKDTSVLTSEFLIRNIDDAFNTWNNSRQKTSFDTFCHYILPYRTLNEQLEYWRQPLRDSLQVQLELYDTLSYRDFNRKILHTVFNPKGSLWPRFYSEFDFAIRPTLMQVATRGECMHLTVYSIAGYRSIGVPTAFDFLPYWGNRADKHDWPMVFNDRESYLLTNKNILFPKELDRTTSLYASQHWKEQEMYLPEGIYAQYVRTIPKVYRRTFNAQQEQLDLINYATDVPIIGGFRNPCLKDVTNEYVETGNIEIKLKEEYQHLKVCYLNVYNHPGGWAPVAVSKIEKDGTVTFNDVGKNIVYMITVIENYKNIDINTPFIYTYDEEMVYFNPDEKNRQPIKLLRKYPYYIRMIEFAASTQEHVFEAANKPDFSDADTLYQIQEFPYYWETVNISNSKKYRYVRIKSKSKTANIAELEFYTQSGGKDKKLEGELMFSKKENKKLMMNCFDGSMHSNQQTAKDSIFWVGIDLGEGNKTKITKIRYCPRNDTNCILSDNEYELFYYNKKWISLGKKVAKTDHLTYSNVPKGALLWLKCHGSGKEERIFSYENNMQMWW